MSPATAAKAIPLLLHRVLRRPDVWVVLAAAAVVATIIATTDFTLTRLDQLTYNHLADSFGAGLLIGAIVVFGGLLLRRTPAGPRRPLATLWIVLTLALTIGLLHTYVWTDFRFTNWILQGGILALIVITTLLTLVLAATGLVRWREIGAVACNVGRHWCTFFFYLLAGGYLLAAVRLDRPVVIDPILLRMDFSLGFSPTEAVAAWVRANPWSGFITHYGYPMLGLMIGGIAASLHFAGDAAGLRRSLLATLLLALLANACYWAAPAIGPVFAFPQLLGGPAAFPDGAAGLDALRQSALAGPDRVELLPDVLRNVMPSLHAAFSLAMLAAAWCHRRRLFWWWLPLGAVEILTTLTLGVHYLVDLFAAVPFAIFCWWLADLAVRRVPPTGDAPLPDLAASPVQRRRLGFALAGSLALALIVLVLWGKFAPISPWLAWPAAALVSALPAWLALRLFTQISPGFRSPAPPALNTQPSTLNSPARLLAGAVFCTGGNALVLEQVSEKYLSTLLGSSRPAATIVLAVYFAGLALGAWLCPRRTAGAARRLALLELFIGAWAVLLALGFFASDRILGAWLATTDGDSLGLARTAVAILWLLPPTIAMGAQLPTLAAVLAGHRDQQGHSLPRYYALNLAGAFTFTLAAPPLLFNSVGANGALWFVALLATFVGVALWTGLPATTNPPPPASPAPSPPIRHSSLVIRHSRLLAAAFAAGFAFFALEIVWFHLISAVCGASTYSFSLLLAAVLLGLALAGRHAARATTPLLVTLGWLVATLAVSNALWPWAGRMLAWTAGLLGLEWFWAGELLKFAVVCLLVVPPAFVLGRIFPQLLGAHSDSTHVARLSLANVLGCVAGALVAGFIFIPVFGAEHTLLGLAFLAAAGWAAHLRSFSFRQLAPGVAGLLLLAFLPAWDRLELTRGYGVYLAPALGRDAKLLSFAEDFHAGFVTVVATPRADGGVTKSLLQNGKFDADDHGEFPAQAGFGLVAAIHAPATSRALVIGAGSGHTASVIARLGFDHLDIVDLSPADIAAAREQFGNINTGIFDRPGVTVHIEDGRQHLLRTRTPYDLIQIELTSVWFAGATNLYSREFYALARDRLSPGGVLVQWIQLHHITPREIATILATARAEFNRVSVWRVGGQACLLASVEPQRINPAIVSRWLTSPELAPERRALRVDSPPDFAVTRLLTPPEVDALLNRHKTAIGLNTDRNRWLEFQAPKYYLSHFDHRAANLRWLTAQADAAPGK